MLPLHIAAFSDHDHPVEVIRILASTYMDALHVRDKLGYFPIHYAIEGGNWQAAAYLLQQHYENAMDLTNSHIASGPLLLFALHHKSPGHFIQKVIEKFPDSPKTKDEEGSLPLPFALRRGMPYDAICPLANAYPGAIAEWEDGETMFHVAAREYQQEDYLKVMTLFIAHRKELLFSRNAEGSLPLHCAVHGRNPGGVRFLLEMWPEAASQPDSKGRLPVHVALELPFSHEIFEVLTDCYPEGLETFDNQGFLPLHTACMYQTSTTEVLETLMKKCPGGAALPSTKNGTSALFVAAENDASLDVLLFLAKRSPDLFSAEEKYCEELRFTFRGTAK
jgi:ankyrin repeat protein